MQGQSSKQQLKCRICLSEKLLLYLDFGLTPLANSYVRKEDLSSEEFKEELALQVCEDCGLSQLTRVVNPDLMFRHYLYVSSTTETFRAHCAGLAKTATAIAGCQAGDLILDIASNDGCLLLKFRDIGMRVVGVDPAKNLAEEANKGGIPTVCAYWSFEAAQAVLRQFGSPKVITATNVIAHVDNIHEFVKAVNHCLALTGIFIIECPYVIDFIENNEFDTVYHEHLSYLGIHPLSVLMANHGFQVVDVQYFENIHGGTIRVFIGRENTYPQSPNVQAFLKKEEEFGIKDRTCYKDFGRRVVANKQKLVGLTGQIHAEGKVMWAYGASAKGNTLMNYLGISSDTVPVVVDDNPKKWGLFTPGAHMRITGIEELGRSKVDYLLLLAWNFEEEIVRRCRAVGYKGAFIRPVPEARLLS